MYYCVIFSRNLPLSASKVMRSAARFSTGRKGQLIQKPVIPGPTDTTVIGHPAQGAASIFLLQRITDAARGNFQKTELLPTFPIA